MHEITGAHITCIVAFQQQNNHLPWMLFLFTSDFVDWHLEHSVLCTHINVKCNYLYALLQTDKRKDWSSSLHRNKHQSFISRCLCIIDTPKITRKFIFFRSKRVTERVSVICMCWRLILIVNKCHWRYWKWDFCSPLRSRQTNIWMSNESKRWKINQISPTIIVVVIRFDEWPIKYFGCLLPLITPFKCDGTMLKFLLHNQFNSQNGTFVLFFSNDYL